MKAVKNAALTRINIVANKIEKHHFKMACSFGVMAMQYNLIGNWFSYFDLAIVLASFLSGNRTSPTAEKGQWIE